MKLNTLLKEKEFSIYKLSKLSGVSYSTLNDICNGKTRLEKSSAETVYKISKALDITVEELLENNKKIDFELFKSNVCHKLKSKGYIDFMVDVLESGEIRKLYNDKNYKESLYLLAMLDYLSRLNEIPICTEYDDIRQTRLEKVVYPRSIVISAKVTNDDSVKERAYQESIPEFRRFNIIENGVFDVV